MFKRKIQPTLILLTLVIVFNGCTSVTKLVDQGRYDEAIDVSLRHLQGKKKKKNKYVVSLEEAFLLATRKDVAQATALQKEGRPENWEAINRIHRRMQRRQSSIEPLLPLYDKKGYKADFLFVKINNLERESRTKAAEYVYAKAQQYLEKAETGDRGSARKAYSELAKIDTYFKDYRDKEALAARALLLGKTNIVFKIENNAPVILPLAFEQELVRMGVRDLNTRWQEYFTTEIPDTRFDYNVVMSITHIDLSPGIVREREYVDRKEIEDGWEYVLDNNGNVLKDTLGNDIKVPRKIMIYADVLETFQNKSARLSGHLEVYDNITKERIRTEPITINTIFENYASTFRGDRRALSRDTRRRIGNTPLPFPSDEAMLLQAAEELKPIIKDKMSYRELI